MIAIIVWILLGLIAGFLAKAIMPGKQGGGFVVTTILGIVGALIGGWLASVFGIVTSVGTLSFGSIVTAVLGALVVLFVYGLLTKGR